MYAFFFIVIKVVRQHLCYNMHHIYATLSNILSPTLLL